MAIWNPSHDAEIQAEFNKKNAKIAELESDIKRMYETKELYREQLKRLILEVWVANEDEFDEDMEDIDRAVAEVQRQIKAEHELTAELASLRRYKEAFEWLEEAGYGDFSIQRVEGGWQAECGWQIAQQEPLEFYTNESIPTEVFATPLEAIESLKSQVEEQG